MKNFWLNRNRNRNLQKIAKLLGAIADVNKQILIGAQGGRSWQQTKKDTKTQQ